MPFTSFVHLWTGPLIDLQFISSAMAGLQAQGFTCLCTPRSEIKTTCQHVLDFYVSVRDRTLDLTLAKQMLYRAISLGWEGILLLQYLLIFTL